MSFDRGAVGRIGEEAACRLLESAGYAIVERNWRCKLGELDIVARQGDVLVIVEVRTRRTATLGRYGMAEESVGFRKKMKLRSLAQAYVKTLKQPAQRLRFDVIAIYIGDDGKMERYKHYEYAF
ncbi:YraN family protein [Paenibacillus sp. J5C_2022]|uniref:YraN family protein n=1 Tax=Paenibacillus sp. J5C2022 TaxID=2977129 RepID=UPI0021D34516|nr:YraN family protein [Paenibacillus sp. J5C2022]MCU6707086.1 YraN family protein [Paenibacillus sp. J5C2022]